jgi:hypothetical protein
VQTQLITDDDRGHYLLFSVGWEEDNREYAPFLHIDVNNNGRVLIQHDGTDLKVALMLAGKGMPLFSKKRYCPVFQKASFHPLHQRPLLPEFAAS